MKQSLKTKKFMKEVFPASGYTITMILNILNYQYWPTLSIIAGFVLTIFMIIFYSMKIYDQFLVTRRRKELKKSLKINEEL